jgi:hypothetical protein
MWHAYKLGKSMRGRRRASRVRFAVVSAALLLITIAVGAVIYDIKSSNSAKPQASKTHTQSVEGSLQTFYSGYFRFQDTGKWVLKQNESSQNKYIYYKYRGLQILGQLIVYVNQIPIPLDLASSRALPVRIINGNSLDATSISAPCSTTYGPSEAHRIKNVSINQATILCDPDTPLYTVVLSEIDGNYILKMQRLSGAPVQFVITFRDYNLDPQPNTLKQITNSFQAL